MAEVAKKPIKITETILRDAHQSLIATRMTTEQILVKTGIIWGSLEGFYHNFCSRLRSTQGKRRYSSIDHIYSCLYSFQISHGSYAGSIV